MTVTGDLPAVKKHLRYRKTFLKCLLEEERRLCSRKIPRVSLLSLDLSPWRTLLDSNVDQSLITMTEFDGASFASLLQKSMFPLLSNVWSTMDGLTLYLQQLGNTEIQACFYNGWTHGHYVTSVFVFCPDGTIPIAFFNVPGSVHDSQVAHWGRVYDKLEAVYDETGGKCTVDSAFGKVNRPFLIKSSQDCLVSTMPTREEQRLDLQRKRQATSMRQAAEWGMRAIQSSFPRLKDTFVYEDTGERRILMKMLCLLYNLRARTVGINQIKNVFMKQLDEDANNEFSMM